MRDHRPPQDFRPADLKKWVFQEIVANVPVEPKEASVILEDITVFLRFLEQRGVLGDPTGCYAAVAPANVPALEKALADPRRHGTMKTLVLDGMREGYDMSNLDDVERFLASRGGPPPTTRPRPKPRKPRR